MTLPLPFAARLSLKTVSVIVLIACLGVLQLSFAFQLTSPEYMVVGRPYADRLLVPTNQVLALSESRVQFPGWPTDMVASPGGDKMALLLSDGIQLVTPDGTLLRRIPLQKPSSGGIIFSSGGRSIITGRSGKSDSLISADVETGQITTLASFGGGSLPTGLALSKDGDVVYVALNAHNEIAAVDVQSGTILSMAPTGIAPFGVALSQDGSKIFVSNRGGRRPLPNEAAALSAGSRVLVDERGVASSGTVTVLEAETLTFIKEIPVGLQPGSLQVSPDGRLLAVANSNSDSLTLIDTDTLEILDTIAIPAFPEGYLGSSPTSVVFSPSGQWLYVACGGNNAVAVLERGVAAPSSDAAEGSLFRLSGYVPVDWYPVALAVLADAEGNETVFAANAKGTGSRTDAGVLNVRSGTLGTVVSFAGGSQSLATSEVSARNNPFSNPGRTEVEDLKSLGVDHVFYIIKENRTYDQILGDLGRGDGDPSLTQFGWEVTPNHHRLAQDFVTLDNYYTSGEVSADGHQWVTQSIVTDYIERAFGKWSRSYPFAGNDPLAFASTGFIWDRARSSGLSVRIFGEFTTVDSGGTRPWLDYYTDAMAPKQSLKVYSHSSIASLNSIVEPTYPGWSLGIPDVYRARVFRDALRGFEKRRDLPNLVILFLPTDHTAGLSRGYPRPASMVADNDLALGQIVDAITHSSYWRRSAIFVTEDDSQDGVDHVDGHRTVGLVMSPFVKRGRVESIHYNQTSMIRTIEELLGMPPMNKFDASALPMRSIFTRNPNLQPYVASLNRVRLDDLISSIDRLDTNEKSAALESMAMDFTHPDAAPEDKLNRIIWHTVKGWATAYPQIVHRWGCSDLDPDDPR